MHSIEAQIRKHQNMLQCSGLAVIMFGAWFIINVILLHFFNRNYLIDLIGIDEDIPRDLFEIIVVIIAIIILFIDLLVRIYIGMAAMEEGKGHYRRHRTYIIIAILHALLNIESAVHQFYADIIEHAGFNMFVNNLISLSTSIATVEIIISAIQIRRLEKKRSRIS